MSRARREGGNCASLILAVNAHTSESKGRPNIQRVADREMRV